MGNSLPPAPGHRQWPPLPRLETRARLAFGRPDRLRLFSGQSCTVLLCRADRRLDRRDVGLVARRLRRRAGDGAGHAVRRSPHHPAHAGRQLAHGRRHQQHVAGPVHVRRQRATGDLQQRYMEMYQLVGRRREARLHAAPACSNTASPPAPSRAIPSNTGACWSPPWRKARRPRNEVKSARRAHDLRHQPADGRRRLGGDARGHHRAARRRARTRLDAGAAAAARHYRAGDHRVPPARRGSPAHGDRRRHGDALDRHHAVRPIPARPRKSAEGAVAASNDASTNVETAAIAADELAGSIGEIGRQLGHDHRHRARGGRRGARAPIEQITRAGAGRAEDRRRGQADPHHRRADQSAGAQRHHRSGARRRSRQGLCGGGLRGQIAGGADRESDRGHLPADHRRYRRRPRSAVDAIGRIAGRMQEIDSCATAVSAAVEAAERGHRRDFAERRQRRRRRQARGVGAGRCRRRRQRDAAIGAKACSPPRRRWKPPPPNCATKSKASSPASPPDQPNSAAQPIKHRGQRRRRRDRDDPGGDDLLAPPPSAPPTPSWPRRRR